MRKFDSVFQAQPIVVSIMSNVEEDFRVGINNPGWGDPEDAFDESVGNWGELSQNGILLLRGGAYFTWLREVVITEDGSVITMFRKGTDRAKRLVIQKC